MNETMLERRSRYAAWLLAAASLFFVLKLHLLPALLAGLLIFELVHITAPRLQRLVADERAKLAAVAVLASLAVGLTSAAVFALIHYVRNDAGSLPILLARMAEIIEQSRAAMPAWLAEYMPANTAAMHTAIAAWLKDHAAEVQLVGKEAGHTLAQVLIGMVIGAMVSLYEAISFTGLKPLAGALHERARRLAEAFRLVVFAQVRISALNTTLTALYLMVLLPLFDVHLPFTKTLVVLTFVTGLLPVIGNLISNTVIVVVSLAHSPQMALASLAFLVVIHKLEYFLNARIVGAHIHARAWELLLAMLTMEAAFGLAGLVAAPIFYAYLKAELVDAGLV